MGNWSQKLFVATRQSCVKNDFKRFLKKKIRHEFYVLFSLEQQVVSWENIALVCRAEAREEVDLVHI